MKEFFSSEEVAVAAGITYRQLDWWVRKGYLTPTVESTGSGVPRQWSLRDLVDVAFFAGLVRDCPLPHGADLRGDWT